MLFVEENEKIGNCFAIFQQVNALEITPSGQMVAACGYQHIRMYDLASANPDPVMNFEGVTKNVSRVGFHVRI